jgi:hypothetical protein
MRNEAHMRNARRRLERLEHPYGNLSQATRRTYAFLRACHAILASIDHAPMPSEAELWAWADAEARSGQAPDFTGALEAVWRARDEQP